MPSVLLSIGWIAFDVAICLRTAFMTAPMSWFEIGIWGTVGLLLGIMALAAAWHEREQRHQDEIKYERDRGELKAQIERSSGYNQGAFQRLGLQIDQLAEARPEFKEEATKLKEELKAQDPPVPLRKSWLDKRITTPLSEEPIYKAKLTLLFRNDSDQPIYVQRPNWSGVGTQSPFGFGYQREVTKGEADWDERAQSALPARIDPGWSFKLWIGLDPAIQDRELRKRFDRVQLGTLIIPVKVANNEILKEYHV